MNTPHATCPTPVHHRPPRHGLFTLLLAALALAAFVLVACGGDDKDTAAALDADGCSLTTAASLASAQSSAFCRGKANFHDRQLVGLGGKGRSCNDCHSATERFQLSPATAQARLAAMTASGVDDPLFRAIDADDFRSLGAAAHDFTNLTVNGLVRVTMPLPANVVLLDCGATVPCPASARPTAETHADIWRAVPSILDTRITGPDGQAPAWPRGANPSGGYQLDGRIDTLQNQALSALRSHAATTVDPQAGFLDDLAAFQNAMSSSPGVKLLADAMGAGTSASALPDPDPVLNAIEQQGKAIFNRACGQCHGNLAAHPSGSAPIRQGSAGTPTALVRYHDIITACPRPVDTVNPPRFVFAACSPSQMRNVRTYQITNSGVAPSGTPCGGAAPLPACVTRVTTSDPGRLLLTGYPAAGGAGRHPEDGHSQFAGHHPHRALLLQQHRRHAGRDAGTLQAVFQTRSGAEPGGTTADHPAGRDSASDRPPIQRCRNRSAAGLLAQTVRRAPAA